MYSTKLTKKNQTTIPKGIRKFLGIRPGERVEWVMTEIPGFEKLVEKAAKESSE